MYWILGALKSRLGGPNNLAPALGMIDVCCSNVVSLWCKIVEVMLQTHL